MCESGVARFPDQERAVNNMASALNMTFQGIGFLIGPIYASGFNDWIGFRLTEDITACLNLAMAIMYFFIADGASAFSTTCRNIRNPPKKNPEITTLNDISSENSSHHKA